MFSLRDLSLRDLRFLLCSRDFDVLRAQRIMDFFILITHKSTRSENPDSDGKIPRMLTLRHKGIPKNFMPFAFLNYCPDTFMEYLLEYLLEYFHRT